MKRQLVIFVVGLLILLAVNLSASKESKIDIEEKVEQVERFLPHGDNYCIMIPTDKFASYKTIYTKGNNSITNMDVYIYYKPDKIPIEVLRILYDNDCIDEIWSWIDGGYYYESRSDGNLWITNVDKNPIPWSGNHTNITITKSIVKGIGN